MLAFRFSFGLCRFLLAGMIAASLVGVALADPSPENGAVKKPAVVRKISASVPADSGSSSDGPAPNTAAIVRLTQSNQDLIDLLKKQQAVLEDIQYDRRLQNRQISSLEDRLQEAMQENARLQAKVAVLEAQIAVTPASPNPASAPVAKPVPGESVSVTPPLPAAPVTYLPAPEGEGAPGTKTWHRMISLSGSEAKSSDVFHIEGRQWRVLWHNQDRPGKAYENTSALFINAYAKNDTVPQKVCSKLGSGGDSTELNGPGNFFVKVEASGGSWELAVEDFK